MSSSAFARRLADIAGKQYDKYHLLREQDPVLAAQIALYWQGIEAFEDVSVPWSAVFVSSCVRQAGATASEFRFAAAHSQFVNAAIRNQISNVGVIRGRDPADYAPKLGDILQNNRSGKHFDYAYATTHSAYISHSAIVTEVGTDNRGKYLRTIGGNENDSVGMKEVRLKPSGLVLNPIAIYICVIETLK